jgi:hypothetical protein
LLTSDALTDLARRCSTALGELFTLRGVEGVGTIVVLVDADGYRVMPNGLNTTVAIGALHRAAYALDAAQREHDRQRIESEPPEQQSFEQRVRELAARPFAEATQTAAVDRGMLTEARVPVIDAAFPEEREP